MTGNVLYIYTTVDIFSEPTPPLVLKDFFKGKTSTVNPFSHYVICVSRLTASGHMRHPLKADLGENEDEFCVCLCVRPPEQVPPDLFKQSERGGIPRFSL